MRPESEAELAQIVAGLTAPVRIRGGGTRGVPGPDAELDVSGLSGITLYEPGALTLVAKAGTPVAEIETALAAEGQRLAFEPMDHRGVMATEGTPTIGGVVAGNISGPRRIQAGAARDFLLGVRYVDGMGQVISNGGRVMKNVTGYDLVKLMAGSWGTLGVLSEVSLKVLPKAETQATLMVSVPDAGTAVRALSAGLGSPYEVTGAAYDPALGQALVRIEGFEASVDYRAEALSRLFAPFGTVARLEDDPWPGIRDVTPFQGRVGDVWRISVKPGDAPELAERCKAEALLFDWGGGLIWALMPEGADLRGRLGEFAGHATLVRGDRTQRAMFQPEPAPLAALSRGLRQRFDPKGLFNPGLMG
ncbi:FAD-binding protein [Ruegeria sp. PrR005]|uniref:FAD-binding protein n=1 Tax=Ruegeria sp. PrR005 TaxID=2706882 RepID=UPI0019453E84|nr:FAD-binding protein [Ruegeria sp. PrR005]